MGKLSCNLGASASWNLLGLSRPVQGFLYLYLVVRWNWLGYSYSQAQKVRTFKINHWQRESPQGQGTVELSRPRADMTQWDTLCVYRLRVGCSQNWWFSASHVEGTETVGWRETQGKRCAEYSNSFDPKTLSSQWSDSANGDVTWDRNKDAQQCFKRYYYTQNTFNRTARWKMVVLEICEKELKIVEPCNL